MGRLLVQGFLPTVYVIQISELINSEWAQAREPNPPSQKKKKHVFFLASLIIGSKCEIM
jgi:hypothetical protein